MYLYPSMVQTEGGYELTVNVSNVGFGQRNVLLYLSMQGAPGTSAVRVPAKQLTSGYDGKTASDTAVFVMPAWLGANVGFWLVVLDASTGTERSSSVVVDSMSGPSIAKVISVLRASGSVYCPVIDPETNSTGVPTAYLVTLSGSGFGPGSADGHSALRSVGASAALEVFMSHNGFTFPAVLTCVESWSDSTIVFAVPYSGLAQVNVSSTGYGSVASMQSSNVVSFELDSPMINALSTSGAMDNSIPVNVPTNGESA